MEDLIINEYNKYLETGQFHFFTTASVIQYLKDKKLIPEILEIKEGDLWRATTLVLNNPNLDNIDKKRIRDENIKNKLVIARAETMNNLKVINDLFEKLSKSKSQLLLN